MGKLVTVIAVNLAIVAATSAQTLLEEDVTLGLNLHNRITASNPVISQSEAAERLKAVFSQLVSTSIAKNSPVSGYQLFGSEQEFEGRPI